MSKSKTPSISASLSVSIKKPDFEYDPDTDYDFVVPKVNPKVSPKVSPKANPKVSPKANPKVSPKANPKAEEEGSDLKELTNWQKECTLVYLRKRRDEFYKDLTTDEEGCKFSALNCRSDGYAQVKLRWSTLEGLHEATPRPWHVDLFVNGIRLKNGYDGSHICGRGTDGCVNQDHVVVEPHRINVDRKKCHMRTRCPCGCKVDHAVRKCTHEPRCIQKDHFVVPDEQQQTN